jgi:hypothetical protein
MGSAMPPGKMTMLEINPLTIRTRGKPTKTLKAYAIAILGACVRTQVSTVIDIVDGRE